MPKRAPFAIAAVLAAALGAFPLLAQSKPASPAPKPAVGPRFEYRPYAYNRSVLRPQTFYLFATGTNLTPNAEYASTLSFAKCVANVSPSLTAQLLSLDPRSGRSAGLTRQLRGISKGCLPAGTFVPTTFLRGALAETLYRRGPAPVGFGNSDAGAKPAAVGTVSECLFTLSPVAVDGFLRSDLGTERERGALMQLAAVAPRCIVAGRRLNISEVAPYLRAGLAEVAYRSVSSRTASLTS
jgi:hypothetical protein